MHMRNTSSSCFSEHNAFVNEEGDLIMFGRNEEGQCGTGDIYNDVLTPTKILNNPHIVSVVLGKYTSFYLEDNGNLYGCGKNDDRQLGIPSDKEDRDKFVLISSNVKKVAATERLTFIQKDDGRIFWSGFWRELELKSVGFEKEIKITDVESFYVGSENVFFLKKNKEVWVMGSNEYNECGFDDNILAPTFLLRDENIVSICCGKKHSFILSKNEKGESVLKTIGWNFYGQLGLGNKINQQQFVIVENAPKNIASVHCGENFSLLLTEDGDVYGAGYNYDRQLGFDNHKCRVFTKNEFTNITHITTGNLHTVLVNDKNEVFVMGNGDRGLGLGDLSVPPKPTKLGDFKIKLLHNN